MLILLVWQPHLIRRSKMAYLIFTAIFFMAVSVAAAVKGDWTVWIIATFAMFYFVNQVKEG